MAKRPAWEAAVRVPDTAHGQGPGGAGGADLEGIPLERQGDLLRLYRRLSAAQGRPTQLERLLRTLSEAVGELLAAEAAAVCTLEPEDGLVRVRAGVGSLARHEGEFLPLEGSLEGHAATAGAVLETPDLAADARAYLPRERGLPSGPALAIPLREGERPLGTVLALRARGADSFGGTDVAVARVAGEAMSAALAGALAYEQARQSRARVQSWRKERDLVARLERLEAIARARGMTWFEWEPRSNRLLCGEGAASLGFSPDPSGATLEGWAERVPSEDRSRVVERLRALRPGEEARVETAVVGTGGVQRPVLLHAFATDEAAGGGVVLGVLEDAAGPAYERGRVPEARGPAIPVNESVPLRQIIRALRHEVNNPLAVIRGRVQLLQQETAIQNDPMLEQSVDAIDSESKRLSELTRRLAALEQSSEGLRVDEAGGLDLSRLDKRSGG